MAFKFRIMLIPISAILGGLALGSALYMLRSPVIIIIDDKFTTLYGIQRSQEKRIETSIGLFRRIKVVQIADGASPDVVAFAAEAADPKPYAALFPFSYLQGARRYAEQVPGIPVGVFAGGARTRIAEEEGLVFIETDRKNDFYRAGRCAAIFALRDGGAVLFFTDDLVTWDDKSAFLKGLQDQGFTNNPTIVDFGEDYTLPEGLSCVVMARAEEKYLENNSPVPMILFSWLDPHLTAREIKLIFDDSPWALAASAAKVLHGEEDLSPVASKILVFKNRIGDTELQENIKKAIMNKYIN